MRFSKNIAFLFQFTTIGLALAFVIVYLYPNLLGQSNAPIQLQQNTTDHPRNDLNNTMGVVSYASAVQKSAPTVVNIYATQMVEERQPALLEDPFFKHFFGGPEGQQPQRSEASLGSGVIMDKQGYILTNNHVIKDASEIAVVLYDGRSASAKIVGADPESDLAIIKIDLPDLPVATLGQSEKLLVGDVVLAIGNPFGVGQTVTSGIVSGLARSGLGFNTFENYIQTDAAINPGNSGGALINAYGELVGINTAIFSKSGGSQGIGFAVPIKLAKSVLTELVEHGRVIRGWLGIKIQNLNPELANALKLESTEGVVISNIVLNGPADKAKLDRGDVITHVNGNKVRDFRETLNHISKHKPGEQIELSIVRNGEKMKTKATVAERPSTN